MQPLSETDPTPAPTKAASAANVDFWMVLDLLLARWVWLAVGALLCGLAAGALAFKVVRPKFTASAQMLRYESPGLGELLRRDAPLSPETFAGLVRSPDLFRLVGERADPPIPPEIFARQIKIDPDADSDLVNVTLAAGDAREAVTLLNIYLTNAVAYLRDLQSRDVRLAADAYLGKEVAQMDRDIADLDKEFRALALPPQITNKVAQIGGQLNELSHNLAGPPRTSPALAMETERLNMALGELTGLLSKYTELHPLVRQKEAEVQALKAQLAIDSTNAAAMAAGAPGTAFTTAQTTTPLVNPEFDIIRTKMLSLEQSRLQLVNRQREAELYVANPPGVARVFAPATLSTVHSGHRRVKIAAGGLVGALLGLAGSLALVLLVEFFDGRLKTAADVRRVTRLPVLTSLGDVKKMEREAQTRWAFRTWTLLQGRLSPSAHHGFVCGFTSSSEGDGRSTWIRLLAEAASLTGFRVLTIATRPPNHQEKSGEKHVCDLLDEGLKAREPGEELMKQDIDALNSPAQIAERLTDPNAHPVVHIPLPGWVWNRERRQQWHAALDHWRQIENIVILVELPPADMPETVLLGASLPNLVWLADTGSAEAASTRAQLETMRHARCNFVGAVMNRVTKRSLRMRFPRWLTCLTLLGLLSLRETQAQETHTLAITSPPTNTSFSIVHPWQRAPWQEHLTLGPGDVLNFGLFGQPELALSDVAVGPDGRISFLEAQDIMAAGLTVDELRARLDEELSKYHRAPHSLVTPVAFRSKKYYMLGKVMVKGAYVLDRPLTVLEAIARAKGFENGLVNRSVVDLADFSHSFIARDGKRVPLNFEKLFQSGDLSQNLPIEPGDYIYIAAANLQEVYVVGEVRLPGPVGYSPDQTVLAAITARGGFTDRAYHSRVLVVRGSLNHPEHFVVNVSAVVGGAGLDFPLQPRDIVYVSHRPFVRVEELTDLAATAFIQGLITSWVDTKVIKPTGQ